MSAEKDQGYFRGRRDRGDPQSPVAVQQPAGHCANVGSSSLRDQALDVPQIAAAPGCRLRPRGQRAQVRRARCAITAQLIDAPTNVHVWSKAYDRSLERPVQPPGPDCDGRGAARLAGDPQWQTPAPRQALPNVAAMRNSCMAVSSTTAVPRATSSARSSSTSRPSSSIPQYARAWAELAGTLFPSLWQQSDDRRRAACLALPGRTPGSRAPIRNSRSRRPASRSTTTSRAAASKRATSTCAGDCPRSG